MKMDRVISMPGCLALRVHAHKQYVTMTQRDNKPQRITRRDAYLIYRELNAALNAIDKERGEA